METITIHPKTKEEASLFEQLAKVLNVPFEKQKTESGYNSEFVAKIERSRRDYKTGKGTTVTLDELNNLWK